MFDLFRFRPRFAATLSIIPERDPPFSFAALSRTVASAWNKASFFFSPIFLVFDAM